MQATLNKHWHALTAGKPGHRFRDRYRRAQARSESQTLAGRVVRLVLAGLSFGVGVLLVVIPGPAIPFFFLAGALVAADWLWMAKLLDWTEVRLRALGRRFQRVWRRLPRWARVCLLIAGGILSATSTYLTYRLFR